MAAAQAPAQPDAAQIFDDLAAKYSFEPKVRAWLTAENGLAARTLDDFIHAAAVESDLRAFADAAEADNKILAASRLRQAWVALRKTQENDEAIKKRGLDENDLDALLP